MNISDLKSKATSIFGGAKDVALSSKEYYTKKIQFVDDLMQKEIQELSLEDIIGELNKLKDLKEKMADAKTSTKALFKKDESATKEISCPTNADSDKLESIENIITKDEDKK